jgi:hypothetical protein
MKLKQRFRDNRRKLAMKIISWEFLICAYLLLTVLFLVSGCAGYVSATVGDHTVRSGFHLSHDEVKQHDE